MATLNLHDVCNKLTSNQVRSRQTALSDLQRFLNQDDAYFRLLDETTYGGVLHALIRNFTLEAANFRKSGSAQATSLLNISAECFKTSAEKARSLITRSTMKMIVNHVLDCIPTSDVPEYKVVAPSFFATLRLITSHPAHVEQMKKEMWMALVQLCVVHVEVSNWFDLQNPLREAMHTDEDDIASFKTLPMRKEIVDLMFCLQSLCLFPGAPFQGGEESLLSFLLNFLTTYDTVSDARMSAIIALNRVLEHVAVNKMELASKVSFMVLELVCRVWNTRISGFKERLLISLSMVYPHLYHAALQNGLGLQARRNVDKLVEKFTFDLRGQEQKGGLQLEDLVLSSLPSSSPLWRHRPFQSLLGPYFSLNPRSQSSELAWLTLQTKSCFIQLLDLVPCEATQDSPNESDSPRKRRRLLPNLSLRHLLDDIIQHKGQQSGVLISLQTLAFYLNSFQPPSDSLELSEVLFQLEKIGDENKSDIVSWTFICVLCVLGRLGKTPATSLSPISSEQWTRIWISCSKQAALSATCRAACAVMDAIVSNNVLHVRSLIPHVKAVIEYVEQRGPGYFGDSSCDFWNSLLRGLEEAGVTTEAWRHKALTRWVRFRWDVNEKGDLSSQGKRYQLLTFPCLSLFAPTKWGINRQLDFRYLQSLPKSHLAQSLYNSSTQKPLINFLLDSQIDPSHGPADMNQQSIPSTLTSEINLDDILAEKCQEAFARLRPSEERDPISTEDLGWYTSLAMIAILLLPSQDTRSVFTAIIDYISSSSEKLLSVDSCLRAISQCTCPAETSFGNQEVMDPVLQEAASSIYATMPFREFVDDLCRLSGKLEAQGKDNYADIEFTGLQKHVISSPSSLDASWAVRDISKWFMTTEGWRMRLLTRLQTDAHMHHGLTAYRLGEKYFRDLPILNILLAGDQVSRTVFSTCGGESSSVAEALLETFKNDVASTYEWGGNEMTAFAAMALVSAFFSSAKTANPSNVPNLITQLYSWVVKVVIIRDISSVHARLRASQLLRQISKIDVQYGKDTKSETRVGTLLIKMMQHQDMRIQFSLADHIKSTFLCFSFADRIPVYRDIVDNLELDETNIEGFLLRAYTLMQLALTSDDIRRAAMVNLLELGNTESCIFAVHACFRQIADRLYHGQLAELFSENSTQFVHSWIEFEQDIFQFPFQLFGFPNFESWGLSVQSDLISQLVNAGRWEDAMNVFRQSDRFEDLLVRFLPQIISYAYLRGSGESDGGGDVSDRCQAALGFDNYISVLRSRFASSLALIVEKFDDKSLSRESFESVGLSSASDIFSVINIQPLGPSYPDPPEPAFNFRKVIAAIENLRQDLNISSQLLWSPPITIFVIRHLMDRGVCASDTTVALSFLRRIVLVLCIAGKTVYEGYTLEMLLFGLKDFITRDALCREAIQVIKYLFSVSKPYAIAHPVRLRQTVHVLLPAIWRLRSASSDSHCYDVVRDTYSWLDNMVTNGFQAHEDLLATTRLLQILSGNQEKQESSAGQIVEQVILEDETLWSEPKLSHFGLQLLSNVSQVFLEPLATLRRLVTHFMTPNCTHIYSSEEKLWLGLALGRISRETPFCKPEYKSVQERMGDQSHGDGSVSSTVAVLREIFRFMHSERRTSGLLEQALGALTSDSKLNSRNFGANQYVLKYLKSPYVPVGSPVRSWNFPPPSDVLVWTDFKQDFATWHKALACSIAQHLPIQLFATLVPAIDASIGFCQAVFPYLVDECRSQRPYDGSLAKIFNTVLQASFDIDLEYSRLVIRTILFLRERPSVILKNNGEPLVHEISYLDAAHAAVACKMYKTGLMFLEIYEKKVSASSDPFPDEILSKIYRNIGDPDLTYALSQGVSRSWSQLLDVYQLHHDRGGVSGLRRARLRAKIELGTNPTGDDDDLLAVADLVRQTGFPLNSVDILGGASHGNQEHTPTASVYKSAWRLGNWDLPPLMRSNNPDSLIYSVLYQLTQKSMSDEFFTVLHSAIIQLADNVAIGPSSPEITNAVSCLSMFTDLRELFSTSKSVITAGRNWATQILRHAEYGSYEELELSASLHNAVFRIAESQDVVRTMLHASPEDSQIILLESFLNFCHMTRLCGDSDDLVFALAKTGFLEQKFQITPCWPDVCPAVLLERAEVLWKRNENTEAVQTLRTLLASSQANSLSFALSPKEIILAKLASWTSELRLSASDTIVHDLLEPASQSLRARSIVQGQTAGKVFFEYAMFCTTQLEDQHAIADIKRMESLHRTKQNEALRYSDPIKSAERQSNDTNYKRLVRDQDRAVKLAKMDKDELQRLHTSQRTFLKKAVENFLRCFAACSDFDRHVPKFCAIWLKHAKQSGLNAIVADLLEDVPSYKFLPLLHQLFSRLSNDKTDEFQDCLSNLLLRILNEHPFHAVHQLFSTLFSNGEAISQSRSLAAKRIYDRISHTHKIGQITVKELSARLDGLYTAYSDLASIPIDKKNHPTNEIQLSQYPSLKKFRYKDLASLGLPPPSLPIPISPNGDYTAIPFVQKYHSSFKIAGGVNQPKILDSMLSNGKSFRELVKGGNDDLHQDAIMQQIFQQMDGVMQRNRETRRRGMRIRTYKVVPLKPKTGVIEWVLETIPLLEYLERTHVALNPNDWKWSSCRQKIHQAATLDHQSRLRVYQSVCQQFKPVLRFFFLEYFKDPDSWLSRRVNYSRSVAASSMIGHVLGLGDRHGQNILLDKATGEVVHIDLGVAFEQGKMLVVPEVVPFRLTRDMVDGFGISGCEGTFIRASTFALAVFREEEDTISTFLDVLKYDPLYNWTISPLKKWAMQQEMQGETTKTAERQTDTLPEAEADRAMQMVKRKLSSRLSAEADVRRLILEATDEGNLSRMYCGITSDNSSVLEADFQGGQHLHNFG